MHHGNALLAHMHIVALTCCYSHPRSSRFVASIQFIQIVEISHLRPLRCGSSEQGMLVVAMGNGAESDDDYTEKLVEVAYSGK